MRRMLRLRLSTTQRLFITVLIIALTFQWLVLYHYLPNGDEDNSASSPLLLIPRIISGGDGNERSKKKQSIINNKYNLDIYQNIRQQQKQQQPNIEETILIPTHNITWNGIQLSLVSSKTLPTSMIHCVGDNFLPNAWLYRSCQYRNLCFSSSSSSSSSSVGSNTGDTITGGGTVLNFQLFMSDIQQQLQQYWNQWNHNYYARLSTNFNEKSITVSSIGTNPRWARKQNFQWYPKIILQKNEQQQEQQRGQQKKKKKGYNTNNDDDENNYYHYYYRLPSHIVWIPIHVKPSTINNPMSLLMDTLLPIYNLMAMFGWHTEKDDDDDNMEDKDGSGYHQVIKKSLLVTVLNSDAMYVQNQTHYGGDKEEEEEDEWCGSDCLQSIANALSWVGGAKVVLTHQVPPIPPIEVLQNQRRGKGSTTTTTTHGNNENRNHTVVLSSSRTTSMICASYGAAGIGMLTDHGLSRHGLSAKDYSTIRNTGRGPLLYKFRNHILEQILPPQLQNPTNPLVASSSSSTPSPYIITVALPDEKDDAGVVEDQWGTASVSKAMVRALQQAFPTSTNDMGHPHLAVQIQTVPLTPLEQKLELQVLQQRVVTSNVWVTKAGDGSWPALFLPRGATLVLLYDETETVKGGGGGRKKQKHPAMHHFDLWNHASHLKVHWLSLQSILPTLNDKNANTTPMDSTTSGSSHMDLLMELLRDEFQSLLLMEVEKNRPPTDSKVPLSTAAATFNGLDLRLVEESTVPVAADRSDTRSSIRTSRAHCVGENWEWDAANYRSCHVQHLCLDVSQRPSPFVVLPSEFQDRLNATLQSARTKTSAPPYTTIATNLDISVMVGQSVRLGTGEAWFPQMRRPQQQPRGITPNDQDTSLHYYYELPDDTVWLPYYAEQPNANNPGHLLWDYLFPLFNLLTMFGLEHQKLLLTNLDKWCVSYAPYPCWNVTSKFLPLLGVDPQTFSNTYNPHIHVKSQQQQPQPSLVCARNGLAGIGMLTDHGYKKHGQLIDDYRIVQNAGRGPTFWEFRTFMLQQFRKSSTVFMNWTANRRRQNLQRKSPFIITVSIKSSNNPSRRQDFVNQVDAIGKSLSMAGIGADQVSVRTVVMGALSLEEQLQIILESSIIISVIGGSASTAMFLKKNSCLILFFDDLNDFVRAAPPPPPPTAALPAGAGEMPNMMDWDFWNHASYLRVHWLPLKTMNDEVDLQVLVTLIHNEIDTITRLL